MKRLICFLVALMLLVSSAFAETEQLHTLWNMPLDITADEFVEFIESKLEVKATKPKGGYKRVEIVPTSNPLVLFGEKIEIFTYFDEDTEKLTVLRVEFPHKNPLDTMILKDGKSVQTEKQDEWQDYVDRYIANYKLLRDKFGEHTIGQVASELNSEQQFNYELPITDGKVDFASIFKTMQAFPPGVDKDSHVLDTPERSLGIAWNNVSLYATAFAGSDYLFKYLVISPQSLEVPDGLTPFPTRTTDLSDAF